MNPSERHKSMDMRVLSGVHVICMAVDILERRECVPTSSGANPSLAAPTRRVSVLMIEMIFEALVEWCP